MTWPVPVRQPLISSWQSNDLSRRVGTDVVQTCELCFYTGGVIGDVIDLNLSPESLGLMRANAVYLRPMQQTSVGKLGGMTSLTQEEVRRLNEDARRLADVLLPRLKPDEPCPVCNHSRNEGAGGRRGGQNDSRGAFSDNSRDYSPSSPRGGATFKYKPSQAVQCGIASGIDQPPILIEFGKTGARLRAAEKDSNIPTVGGGNSRRSDKDVIQELMQSIEDLKGKNTAQAVELKEVRRELKALEQWKAEHRCETSTNVGALRMQIEVLQENLRELVRGRQEAWAMLQERRRAGATIKDAPHNYAPFATSLPLLSFVDPHTLLSRQSEDPAIQALVDRHHAKKAKLNGNNTNSSQAAKEERERYENDYHNPLAAAEIVKRPSANSFSGGMSAAGDPQDANPWGLNNVEAAVVLNSNAAAAARQAEAQKRAALDIEVCGMNCLPGHCQLRISTTGGDPFIVQRKISSQILHGKNMISLMSLDNIVTDEIFVEELEMVAAPGKCGLILGTRNFEWHLSFNVQERTNWMHWLYALNPWLSANRPTGVLTPAH